MGALGGGAGGALGGGAGGALRGGAGGSIWGRGWGSIGVGWGWVSGREGQGVEWGGWEGVGWVEGCLHVDFSNNICKSARSTHIMEIELCIPTNHMKVRYLHMRSVAKLLVHEFSFSEVIKGETVF